jgi:hypothetical protein
MIQPFIPFIERTVGAEVQAAPLVVKEILGHTAEAEPWVRTSRMIAKKGVSSWGDIGKVPPLPLQERIENTAKVVDRFMDGQWLENLTDTVKASLNGEKKVSLVFTRAYDEGSLNLIPPAMAAKAQRHLAEALPGVEVMIDKDIFQASKANRTSADTAATLLARQQIFEGKVTSGTHYVLLDEHIEAGATLANLENYIRSNGGKVAAIGTLTKNPGAEHMHILPQTLAAIDQAVRESVAGGAIVGKATEKLFEGKIRQQKKLLLDTLAGLGITPETLTNTEGLAVVAHLSKDKAAFDETLKAAGTNLEEYANYGGDYITKLLDLPLQQKTVEALAAGIQQDIQKNYHYVGTQTQQNARG